MYDRIFEDFKTIKKHCKRNGNTKFDESAIFELLENLFPNHGSTQTVQLIIEMLDAQRIRDCKNSCKLENLNSELNETNSKDTESILEIEEVEVVKKVHPIIDLRDDSPKSDEVIEIPNTENINSINGSELFSDTEYRDLNESDNEFHDSSDSDVSKHFDEEWNQTVENIIKSRNESPLMQFLGMNEDSSKLNSNQFEVDQSNSSVTEISEIFEENNNDPNNNLDGTVFYEELGDTDARLNISTPRTSNTLDFRNSNSNHIFIENVINPIPGCSNSDVKDNVINSKEDLPCTVVRGPLSPVPGCSKDFDKSHHFESSIKLDMSIQNDAICIQEIVPWANFETIYSILRKHSNSPNRKQLTLWDLMSEESSQSSNSIMKRKQNENNCTIPNKTAKREKNNDIDESSSDFPPISHLNNTYIESYNDSMSSKILEYNNANSEMIDGNQKKEVSEVTNLSSIKSNKSTHNNLNSFLTDSTNKSINNVNNDLTLGEVTNLSLSNIKVENQAFNHSLTPTVPKIFFNNFPSFIDRSIKKERTETIVSGLLDEISIKKAATEVKSKESVIPLINKYSLKGQSSNTLYSSNNTDIKCNNLLNHNLQKDKGDKVAQIKMELEQAATTFLNDKSTSTEVHQNIKQKIRNQKLDKSNVIKPPKLVFEGTVHNHYPIKRPVLNSSFSKPTATITSAFQSEPTINLGIESSTSCDTRIFPSKFIQVPDFFIYNKLRSMFPDVQSSYVLKLCIYPPNTINSNNKEYVLNTLIDHILKEGVNHLRPVQNYVEQPVLTLSVDERYEYLLGIFPDADPTYLREFVEKNDNSEQIVQFIQEKLETRDYPTKEQYLAKIKITEQQKQYTTDFKVEQFLELFPDPFTHFENKARQCHFQAIAMEFLKSFFTKTKINTILNQYTMNKNNLSLTAKALSSISPDMKSKRVSNEMPTEDIPLLQEMAFIKNKLNIQNHINTLKLKEEQLFKELQEKNLLLTCQCCFNDECMPTKCSECNNGHIFCCECIIRGTDSILADGSAHVRCFTECNSEFSIATLQKVLPPTKFSTLLKKRQAAEVIAAEVEGLVSCPFCHFASIPPPEDKVFKCLNPECMKESCRQCKELNHVPLRCDEVIKSDKARRLIEEKMSEALIRICYKCKRQFYKEDGCNKMTCPCGALMCYLCDKPVLNYKHFNAQGGINSNLCPLWSDDARLNAISVRTVAEEMKSAILKLNPNLQIDTESLIPKVPPKSKGPHDDIPNANKLPEHVQRVVGAAP